MTQTYTTVAGDGMVEFEVRGSRFIGWIRPVGDQSSAESFIETVAGEYPDATHHVPAYRVRVGGGEGHLREFQSDDGEPSGSAGPPALRVLQGQDLLNVVVVVTRYYGGTNLGIGGLVSAYSDAVSAAIEAAGTVTRVPHTDLVIRVAYDDSGTVQSILESLGFEFEAAYEESVTFTVSVPDTDVETVLDRVRSGTSGRATIEA